MTLLYYCEINFLCTQHSLFFKLVAASFISHFSLLFGGRLTIVLHMSLDQRVCCKCCK
jgi:hypothetical protein